MSLLKWGELKNRKGDLNEHLILALDLKLSQPLDLGIPQKSLRVRLKEEKEGKCRSFFHEQIERRRRREKRRFLSSEEKENITLACILRQHFSKSVQQGWHIVQGSFGTFFKVDSVQQLWVCIAR